jgi:hypothetical protein
MIRRVISFTDFVVTINKSKRRELVDFVTKERRRENVPEYEIQVMPLWWVERSPKEKRHDNGEIKAFVRIKDGVVFLIFDNLTDGVEDFHNTRIDADIIDFIGAGSPAGTPPQIVKKDGTPFAGFNGGRKRKVLTDDEMARIREMRDAGHNINDIARALHISNRVISEFVKNN